MGTITAKDRASLRELAECKVAYVQDDKNKAILQKWYTQAEDRRDTPAVRMLFSNLHGKSIEPRLRCTDPEARKIEKTLV